MLKLFGKKILCNRILNEAADYFTEMFWFRQLFKNKIHFNCYSHDKRFVKNNISLFNFDFRCHKQCILGVLFLSGDLFLIFQGSY